MVLAAPRVIAGFFFGWKRDFLTTTTYSGDGMIEDGKDT